MKKITLLLIGIVLLLAACGVSAAEQDNLSSGANQEESQIDQPNEVEKEDLEQTTEDKNIIEYDALAEIALENDLDLNVVEDNKYKRSILLEDENGQEKYKSIFDKKTNRLKIIDFNQGQIFNEVIEAAPAKTSEKKSKNSEKVAKQETAEPSKSTNNGNTNYPEYSPLQKNANAGNLQLKVVEDNQGKRIILLTDSNGKEKYKSIYLKKKGFLKIIEHGKGQIFNQSI